METILTSFKNLLAKSDITGVKDIEIPRIQRSYAQGRPDPHATRTRRRFLSALHNALACGQPLTLDFIYGNVKAGKLIPLDGQQRLTTLYLLHWYAAKREGVDTDILARFSYSTRYSARDFCERMVDYTPLWTQAPSKSIRNEGWFPLDWRNDASVNSMLTMLDAIHERFSDIDNLWERLDLITFYFLPVDEMELTDEIYIKMNSRGKPLTQFEHFKAEFIKCLQEDAPDKAKQTSRKIDIDWTDMLWPFRGEDNIIDDEFLRYFHFVCDLMCYRDNMSADYPDEFTLLERYFKGTRTPENTAFLSDRLDCWVRVAREEGIAHFFERFISTDHRPGKICIPSDWHINLLEDCLRNYEPGERRQRKFTLQKSTLLYAFLVYLLNREKIAEDDFRRRLRVVWNLVRNSQNEVVDNPRGDAGNRMPAILAQTRGIILTGTIATDIIIDNEGRRPNFNTIQLDEETRKLAFTALNPREAEALFRLEDHPLLYGRVEVVGHENTTLYSRFEDLFLCDWDLVDCALLACGDYSRRENNWTIALGTFGQYAKGAWENLFHRGERTQDFAKVSRAMSNLLNTPGRIDEPFLYEIINGYLGRCRNEKRFDWRYYYIKYPSFRRGRYGKYTMAAEKPYELVSLYTGKKESNNSRQCFLWETGAYDTDEYIRSKRYDGAWLKCLNDAFVLVDDNNNILRRLPVPQSPDGIDTEDRIMLFHSNSDTNLWEAADTEPN